MSPTAITILLIIFAFQLYFTINTGRKIILLKRLFPLDGIKYKKSGLTVELDDSYKSKCADLSNILQEVNAYLSKNEGTADFSILMNVVERRINSLVSDAVAKISFPTFCGLLGTFLGVFIGLCAFKSGLNEGIQAHGTLIHDLTVQDTPIHDFMIKELIEGVIISMITSVIGLCCSIGLNWFASYVQKNLNKRKNELYHFLQTELMPELGTDMVSSIAKLRQTINRFEPAFNNVIDRFQNTFDNCTAQFGEAFRDNVQVVAQAVTSMGENINKVNDNIRFQQKILDTLKSKELNKTLDKFADAISKFDELSQSLSLFEQSKREVILATQELTEAQRRFNQDLSIPTELVREVNKLLDRIRTFEDNVNRLGEELQQSDIIGNDQLNLIKEQIQILKQKNAVAAGYVDTTTEELTRFFDNQKENLKGKTNEWNQKLMEYGEAYEAIVNDMQEQMRKRWEEFISQMNNLFDTTKVSDSFEHLKQLEPIYKKIEAIETKLSDTQNMEKKLDAISNEVKTINDTVNALPISSTQLTSKEEKGSTFGNTNAIHQSIQVIEQRMNVVSNMDRRLDEIKRLVERIQPPQHSSTEDNLQYQQRLVMAQDKIKQLQTELDYLKQSRGNITENTIIEELKQELAQKEKRILQLQKQLSETKPTLIERIFGKKRHG